MSWREDCMKGDQPRCRYNSLLAKKPTTQHSLLELILTSEESVVSQKSVRDLPPYTRSFFPL